MRTAFPLTLVTLAFCLVLVPIPASAQTTRDAAACSTLTSLKIPGLDLTITKAEWFAAGSPPPRGGPGAPANPIKLPAYCRLDGVIDRRTGADGKPYGIGFALALPGDWNGRFLFQGGGGLNGSVQAPLGMVATGGTPALARGFAVVSTDTGHTGQNGFDASFMAEQQATLDFAYQAVGRVASVAKQIIAQHYAKAADRSYLRRMFDRRTRGDAHGTASPDVLRRDHLRTPAMRTNFSGIGDEWVATQLNAVAPKNEQGQPLTRQALSEADKKTVIDGFLNACDAGDGIKDGIVFDTNACRFDPKTLVCKGAKADGCLSAEQAVALEKGFAGPKDSKGRQVYPGFLFDTGIAATQGIPGLLHGGLNPVGPASRRRRWTWTRNRRRRWPIRRKHCLQRRGDQPQHVLQPWWQVDLLPRRERSVVLGARYDRLLRAHDQGQWWPDRRQQLEPFVSGSRDGALQRW